MDIIEVTKSYHLFLEKYHLLKAGWFNYHIACTFAIFLSLF